MAKQSPKSETGRKEKGEETVHECVCVKNVWLSRCLSSCVCVCVYARILSRFFRQDCVCVCVWQSRSHFPSGAERYRKAGWLAACTGKETISI